MILRSFSLVLGALTLSGCPAPSTGVCREHPTSPECVDAATDAGPCGGACPVAAPYCDEERNSCVACRAATDCTDVDASYCVVGVCRGCEADSDCAHLAAEGTGVCEPVNDRCVECRANREEACGENACDAATHRCTDRPRASRGPCQECIADSECREGQLCVPMESQGVALGTFCAWREDARTPGPYGTCTRVPPYVRRVERTSVDGVTAMVCELRVTNCLAHADFLGTTCTMPDSWPPYDPACGAEDVDDGFCFALDSVTSRCTVGCTTVQDCPCTGVSCSRQFRCTQGFCSLSETCPTTGCP